MKFKSLILLALAMGCGLVAMLGVQQILSGRGTPAPDTVKVLVARQEINPGFELDETLVEFRDWAKDAVPLGAVTEPSQYLKRALKVRAFPGEVILQPKLGEKGAYGASAAIAPGMRVVSVPVNNTSANSGMISPGDRVDILVTYKSQKPGGSAASRTKPVLEFIEVFAVDRIRGMDSAGGDTNKTVAKAENISVIVTPQQSLILMHYINKGTIQIALRNPDDSKEIKATTVDDTISDDLDAPNAKVAAVAEVALEPTPAPEAKTEEKPPENFKTFLNAEATPAAASPTPVGPNKKYWEIKIYTGETFSVEKVELPEDHRPRRGRVQANSPIPVPEKPSQEKPVATSA